MKNPVHVIFKTIGKDDWQDIDCIRSNQRLWYHRGGMVFLAPFVEF
jgi:hypothetical protein